MAITPAPIPGGDLRKSMFQISFKPANHPARTVFGRQVDSPDGASHMKNLLLCAFAGLMIVACGDGAQDVSTVTKAPTSAP